MLMAGWLTKQTGLLRTWKRRFFVLQENGYLCSFREPGKKAPEETLDVSDIQASRACSGTSPIGKGYGFELVTIGSLSILIADTEEEMKLWVQAIGNAKIMSEHPSEQVRMEFPPVQYTEKRRDQEYSGLNKNADSVRKGEHGGGDEVITMEPIDPKRERELQREKERLKVQEEERERAREKEEERKARELETKERMAAEQEREREVERQREIDRQREEEKERQRREREAEKELEREKDSFLSSPVAKIESQAMFSSSTASSMSSRLEAQSYRQRTQQRRTLRKWVDLNYEKASGEVIQKENEEDSHPFASLDSSESVAKLLSYLFERNGQDKQSSQVKENEHSFDKILELLNDELREKLGASLHSSISPSALLSHTTKSQEELVWALIYLFEIVPPSPSQTSLVSLYDWTSYLSMSVSSYSASCLSDFKDGIALCAVFAAADPSALSLSSLKAYKPIDNFSAALKAGEEAFGIPVLLDENDCDDLDETALLIYLAVARRIIDM